MKRRRAIEIFILLVFLGILVSSAILISIRAWRVIFGLSISMIGFVTILNFHIDTDTLTSRILDAITSASVPPKKYTSYWAAIIAIACGIFVALCPTEWLELNRHLP